MKTTNASELFSANYFLQKSYFKKNIFLLNHTSWGYFLDYMNLPYQFGILRMCTFCWFDWFLSKPSIILVIHTNTCALFFSSDLIMYTMYFLEFCQFTITFSIHIGYLCARHTMPHLLSSNSVNCIYDLYKPRMKFNWCSLMPLMISELPIMIHHQLQIFSFGDIF